MPYSRDEALVIVALRRLDLLTERLEEAEELLGKQADAIHSLECHRYIHFGLMCGLDKRLEKYLQSTIGFLRTGDSKVATASMLNVKRKTKSVKPTPSTLNLGEWDV